MITFLLFVALVAAALIIGYTLFQGKETYKGAYTAPRRLWIGWSLGILLVAYLPMSLIWAAVQYNSAADITNSQYVIEQLEEQRDELAAALEENLSSDDFAQLMEAATPEDLLFLKNNPQVSDFMLGRADRIVGINSRLYAEQNKLLDQARGVCNYTDNPLIPKIPFIGPDCSLGDLQDSYKILPQSEKND